MQSAIKTIVSRYIKVDVDSIGDSTIIDKSAVKGSILVHRLYAELSAAGFPVDNYMSVRTYGDLVAHLSGTQPSVMFAPSEVKTRSPQDETGIGIDTETVANLPDCPDFREDRFYTMNFSQREISYCIVQPDPKASFAGLFAAKEAIVKCDNRYRNKPFNLIEIDHDMSGKPVFENMHLSISHTNELAIAVAASLIVLPDPAPTESTILKTNNEPLQKVKKWPSIVAVLSLFMNILLVALFLLKYYHVL